MTYSGNAPEKWAALQKEINSSRIVSPSFKKNIEEKIEVDNAKLKWRKEISSLGYTKRSYKYTKILTV